LCFGPQIPFHLNTPSFATHINQSILNNVTYSNNRYQCK
jgi:hypothetical protein